jgi:S-formylglutathione hydrolase FrmB
MNARKSWLLGICIGVAQVGMAAQVDTIQIQSASMKKTIAAVVIIPDAAKKDPSKKFPTVYLLHGYSGRYDNWIQKVPALQTYADRYGLIVVCPDGSYACAYIDSPIDSNYRYDTHITQELIPFVEKKYPAISDRKNRAITGLSMGGHGALTLAWRHSDLFSACGSMSGAVHLEKLINYPRFYPIIGDTTNQRNNWQAFSMIRMIEKPTALPLLIYFDCGQEDFLYESNKNLHEKMKRLGINHVYTEGPGGHTWSYWENSLAYQLLFFHRQFTMK